MPRLVRRHPGYVAFATITLASAAGINLIVFTIVNALWLRPLPFPNAERLVVIASGSDGPGDAAFVNLSSPAWQTFDAVAGQVITSDSESGLRPRIQFDGVSRALETLGVTPEYFPLFELDVRGRNFTTADDRPGAEPVAIISDRLWSREFERRGDIVGAVFPAKPFPIRIVGVAPRGFEGARRGESVDVWIPSNLVPAVATTSGAGGVTLMLLARLHRGQTVLEAARGLAQADKEQWTRWTRAGVTIVPLEDVFGTAESRTVLIRELGAMTVVGSVAALVLLGGCATLAALVLVHFERRRRELALRIALGSSRIRLISSLFGELGVVAVAGMAGAVLLATRGVRILPSLPLSGSIDLSRLDLSIDWRVCAAAVGTCALTLALAAVLPILRFTRGVLAADLLAGATATATASSHAARRFLLALHVCATILVLIAAGLFIRAVAHGFGGASGFDSRRTVFVTVQTLPPSRAMGSIEAEVGLIAARAMRVRGALESLPGVEAIAAGTAPIGPYQARTINTPVTIETARGRRELRLGRIFGSPHLLRTLGIPVVMGRELTPADALANPSPAIVTESLAMKLWPAENPLGRTMTVTDRDGSYTIVGVARDFVYGSFSRPADGVVFVTRPEIFGIEPQFALRVAQPEAFVEPIRRAVSKALPDAPWLNVDTGLTIVRNDLARQRLGAWFFSGFGLTALILGVGGVFGLVSYATEMRQREFAVRLALGATPNRLLLHSLSDAVIPVAVGIVIGLGLSALVSRVFASLLAGLSPLDPLTYAAVAVTMAATATIAAITGAWPVRYHEPTVTLRRD
jgi:predicted permease